MSRLILALWVAALQAAGAASYTWKGGGGAWDTVSPNWSDAGAVWPASGTDNDAVFPWPGGAVTLSGPTIANDLSFAATDYTLDGGSVTLNWSPGVITVAPGGRAAISSPLAGTPALVKAGDGVLTLKGACTRAGHTTLTGGTLRVTGGGRLYYGTDTDTAVVTVGPGTVLELDTWFRGDSQSLGRLGIGAQRIVINGGTIRMNGATGSGRGVTINSGGAAFEAAAGADWMIHTFTDDVNFVYNGNPSIILSGAGIGRFEKVFSGSGSVTKRGTGKWTLRRTNTYTGATTVEQGVLTLIRACLDDSSTVTVLRGAVLDLQFAGGDRVGQLILGGASMPAGTYNRTTHPASFTGIGSLVVGGAAFTSTPPYNYGLANGGAGWADNIRNDIVNAMNYAVGMYNSYGIFQAYITANYNSGVPTAQCGYLSWLDFGGMRSGRVALHEMGHFFGVGTHWAWGSKLANGQYTGPAAIRLVRQIDGPDAMLYSDGTHFWPYGLNYDNESSTRNDTVHVRVMDAFRRDLGDLNAAPSLVPPPAQAVLCNGSTGPVPFTVADAETAAGSLAVTVSSDNPALVPESAIVLGGSGATRTIHITPAPSQTGSATITLMVMDGTDATAASFQLGVGGSTLPAASGADDAEESASGSMLLTSSDIELVNDDATGAGDQVAGLRFASVPLPAGALVTSAHIQFTADETGSDATSLEIAAEAADNAAGFLTNRYDLTRRALLPSRIVWTPPPWPVAGENGPAQRTPSLVALVQEIVNRPGWMPGNAMAFLVSGQGRRTAEAFDKAGGTPAQLVLTFTTPDPLFTTYVNSSANDAEESAAGPVNLNSSDLELVNDPDAGAGIQTVGLRFENLALPPGARITSARLRFRTDEVQSETTTLTVRAQAADTAPVFTTNTGNLSTRPVTAAAVEWRPAAWTAVGDSGLAQCTPDLAAMVQEIVSRPGWAGGNALAFLVTGSGHRTAEAFDKAGGVPPSLTITYSTGAPPAGSFAQWIASFPGLADPGPGADPDGDGLHNLAEFAFGLDPSQPGPAPVSAERGSGWLGLRYTRRSVASGIVYAVEWSETLTPGQWSAAGVSQQILSDDGLLRVVRATIQPGAARALFLRLRIAQQ